MNPLVHELREIPLGRKAARDCLAAFLARHDLTLDPMLERYFGIFEGDDLVAGAGYYRQTIKCAAIDGSCRGEGLLNTLVSHIVAEQTCHGHDTLMVFTKPENTGIFESLGFRTVAQSPRAVLMDNNPHILQKFQKLLESRKRSGVTGALVMNCNPFTLGHRHIVETAASRCDNLFLFVVEEDVSAFPFSVRLELVKQGTMDLEIVSVVAGGPYVISSATFPSYFLKDASAAARAHAELDATVFGTRIAPSSGATVRFVGEEPHCPLTSLYNRTLQEILPPLGMRVEVVPRKCADGDVISASRVRRLLSSGELSSTRHLVPESTFRYLSSPEGRGIAAKLQQTGS